MGGVLIDGRLDLYDDLDSAILAYREVLMTVQELPE